MGVEGFVRQVPPLKFSINSQVFGQIQGVITAFFFLKVSLKPFNFVPV
jgi:hypothetical protein